MGTLSDKEAETIAPKFTSVPDFDSPQKHGPSKFKCSTCDGRGVVVITGRTLRKARVTCSNCVGMGTTRIRCDSPRVGL